MSYSKANNYPAYSKNNPLLYLKIILTAFFILLSLVYLKGALKKVRQCLSLTKEKRNPRNYKKTSITSIAKVHIYVKRNVYKILRVTRYIWRKKIIITFRKDVFNSICHKSCAMRWTGVSGRWLRFLPWSPSSTSVKWRSHTNTSLIFWAKRHINDNFPEFEKVAVINQKHQMKNHGSVLISDWNRSKREVSVEKYCENTKYNKM